MEQLLLWSQKIFSVLKLHKTIYKITFGDLSLLLSLDCARALYDPKIMNMNPTIIGVVYLKLFLCDIIFIFLSPFPRDFPYYFL